MNRIVVLALSIATFAPVESRSQAPSGSRIPLRTGLTIVTALNDPDRGDYESIKRFIDVNDKTAKLRYSAEVPNSSEDNPLAALLGGDRQAKPASKPGATGTRKINAARTINRSDLETATDYRSFFGEGMPDVFPGSTAVGVSRKVLHNLNNKGESELRAPETGIVAAMSNLLSNLLGSGQFDDSTMLSGTLKRVESKPLPFKVIVNDDPVELMAIHARGRLGDQDADFLILNDGDNPLALQWQVGDVRLRVIRLSYPETVATTLADNRPAAPSGPGAGGMNADAGNAAAGTAKRIEADLAKEGRAIVYGIYFDFASDRIKEESEPVLAEIAQVLRENPTWNLNVEGHTDSVGGDAYNLDLSRRRSAAVRHALTSRYKIALDRLQTSGYGAARPKDRNNTMEGRARNRRVELVKG